MKERMCKRGKDWNRPLLLVILVVLLLFCMLPAMADEEAPLEDIGYGSTGDDVLRLQTRLIELGYFGENEEVNLAVFDKVTQQALERFCRCNKIDYRDSGATADIQYVVFSNGAQKYDVKMEHYTSFQKLTAYMTRSETLFGTGVPMWCTWLISLLLVVLLVVLVIYFFVPSEDKKKEVLQQGRQQYWRHYIQEEQDGSSELAEKMSRDSAEVDLQVIYNGAVKNIRCNCTKPATIGRKDCTILLAADDRMASSSHCEIYFRGAVLTLRDHSSNGTRINGRVLHRAECRINPGDQIQVGSHVITVQPRRT